MMKKVLIFLVIVSLLASIGEVVAGGTDTTELSSILSDLVSISVTPESINFGSIMQGKNITVSGSNITINTSESDTATNSVYVYIDINGTDKAFYEGLLEFGEGSPIIWTDIVDINEIVISEGQSKVYRTRLQGNTEQFNAGSKIATITYTAYGASQL